MVQIIQLSHGGVSVRYQTVMSQLVLMSVSLGGTQTDLNGITSLDVDNITIDANTISTTNSNGNLVISPNGTGTVTVPSGYESRTGFGR